MPSPEVRALSLQQQYALELVAERTGDLAAGVLAATPGFSRTEVETLARQYDALISGAVAAAAGIRAGYLSSVSSMAGEALDVPWEKLARPDLKEILLRGDSPQGAVYAAVSKLDEWLADQAADDAEAVVSAVARSPRAKAEALLREYADSTVTAGADYVDRAVLLPNRRVVALRRIAHPNACERCFAVSKVLVFKEAPALRHPQCRCSFEPVFLGDQDYRERLARYDVNARSRFTTTRREARLQQEDARNREEDEYLQGLWRRFLGDEQDRLAQMVRTVPSTTWRDWSLMVSEGITSVGGEFLPVVTRT